MHTQLSRWTPLSQATIHHYRLLNNRRKGMTTATTNAIHCTTTEAFSAARLMHPFAAAAVLLQINQSPYVQFSFGPSSLPWSITPVLPYSTSASFALLTVFLAVPISSGGLGQTPQRIGVILGISGFLSGSFQLLMFARIRSAMGPKRLFLTAVCMYWLMFPAFMIMHRLAVASSSVSQGPNAGDDETEVVLSRWVWIILTLQLGCWVIIGMGYSCMFMYVTASSPSPSHLGSVNGLAQTVVSFVRALGPAGATTLFSLSVVKGWMGGYFVFWFFMGMNFGVLGCALLLPADVKLNKGSVGETGDA